MRTDANGRMTATAQVSARRSPQLRYDNGGSAPPSAARPRGYDRPVSLDEPLLSVAQTAELLNVGASTVYYLVNIGELPHRRVGRRIRFYRPDLESYLDAQRPPAA
jgi:excisionase family DNA binding protein